MTADDLLDIANELVRRDAGRPRQASLKRSVSTAYYALFHALAHECVDQTIGWTFRDPNYWQVVSPLYRAIDHAATKRLFIQFLNNATVSPQLKQVARTFVDLQAERIRADYDPEPTFTRPDSLLVVEQAGAAIATLRSLPKETKRSLAVQLLTKQR